MGSSSSRGGRRGCVVPGGTFRCNHVFVAEARSRCRKSRRAGTRSTLQPQRGDRRVACFRVVCGSMWGPSGSTGDHSMLPQKTRKHGTRRIRRPVGAWRAEGRCPGVPRRQTPSPLHPRLSAPAGRSACGPSGLTNGRRHGCGVPKGRTNHASQASVVAALRSATHGSQPPNGGRARQRPNSSMNSAGERTRTPWRAPTGKCRRFPVTRASARPAMATSRNFASWR